MKIRKTSAVRRGLQLVHALAEADVQADDSEETSRFTKRQREEVSRALTWIQQQASAATVRDEP